MVIFERRKIIDFFLKGNGQFKWNDGVSFKGDFVLNTIDGNGEYKWIDGSTYKGTLKENKREGFGVFKAPNDDAVYEG